MNIVITMAGLGSRFRKAGYQLPKYMIEAHGKTLFKWSMLSLNNFWKLKPNVVFIVREQDHAEGFIRETCDSLQISNISIMEIASLTKGQAETCILSVDYWIRNEPLFIFNIDTFIEPDAIIPEQFHGDGFIPCFKGLGDHWSFVKLDDSAKAVEVQEKKRISEYCSVGAYYFKNCEQFISLYQMKYGDNIVQDEEERYIAPLYNDLIQKGGEVFISDLPCNKVHVLGTPEELEVFQKENFVSIL